jgi:RimJ/RimL family protein N-acetyltransferase
VRTGTVHGPTVVLRPLQPRHGSAIAPLLRDGRVTRFLPGRVRRETGPTFVARVLREARAGEGVAWVIERADDREIVGQIRLLHWHRFEREAEVGYWLRRRFWGHGYGTEALRLACRYGFGPMRLERIAAAVVAGNERSVRVLLHVGFREEGRRRQEVRLGSGRADVIEFGLLRSEGKERPSPPRGGTRQRAPPRTA